MLPDLLLIGLVGLYVCVTLSDIYESLRIQRFFLKKSRTSPADADDINKVGRDCRVCFLFTT